MAEPNESEPMGGASPGTHTKHAKDEDEKGFKVSDRRFWASETEDPAAEPARSEYPSYVEELRAALAEKDQQLREYIAAYKEQLVKGVEETKQRLQRENERELERLRGQVVGELLEVLDNLDRSLEASAQTQNLEALVQGVKLVANQFAAKLQGLGLQRFDAVGELFDPAVHEAIGTTEVTDPSQDGRVVREIKAGYRLGDKVLRPALVQVGKRTA